MPPSKAKPSAKSSPKVGANCRSKTGSTVPTPELGVGAGGEFHQTPSTPETRLATNHGIPVSDNQNTLSACPRGAASTRQWARERNVRILA